MRGVEVVCLGTELREGAIVLFYEAQYSCVECERAELFKQKAYGEEFVEALEGGYCVFAGD
jgi:hypothetical protein